MESGGTDRLRISVVTPTFGRPGEVSALLENLCAQTLLPSQVIIVDGAPAGDSDTEDEVSLWKNGLVPFRIIYLRHSRGTAIQRNAGIEAAEGDLIALIDDDVRLENDFFERIENVFMSDESGAIGGVTGYRTNCYFYPEDAKRWRWYKRLGLLTTFEPGRYDARTGYPINNNMQPPFEGIRRVDFLTTACTVWRREVFDNGLRFHPFFADYGVLEDAHFSISAGKKWVLLQSGEARCRELHSVRGREDRRKIGYKCVVNYYFVFQDQYSPLSAGQKFRFWRFQAFELMRIAMSAISRRSWADVLEVIGRLEGILAATRGIQTNIEPVCRPAMDWQSR